MELLKRIFLRNLGTKLTALLMALALWTYAYFFSLKRETGVEVPLVIQPPAGWAVIEKDPVSLMDTTLTYPTHAENNVKRALSRGEVQAVYRVSSEPEAALIKVFADIPLLPDNFIVSAAPGLKVSTDQRISFTIAKQGTKQLRVVLDHSAPPAGYDMSQDPWWTPREVFVQGPRAALDEVDAIHTRPVTIARPPRPDEPVTGSVTLQDSIEVKGKQYKVTHGDRVEYRIYLSRELAERTFDKVPIRVVGPPDYPYSVRSIQEPDMSVTLRGPEADLAALTPDNLVLFVDVTTRTPETTPQVLNVYHNLRNVPNPALFQVVLPDGKVFVDIQEHAPG